MSIVFALVLLGCSDDGATCQLLATAPERYVSEALCDARQDAALRSDIALRSDHPSVISRCQQVEGRSPVTMALGSRTTGPRGRRDLSGPAARKIAY